MYTCAGITKIGAGVVESPMMLARFTLAALACALCFGAGAQQGVIASDQQVAVELSQQQQWHQLLGHLQQWEPRAEIDQKRFIFRMRADALETLGDFPGAVKALKQLQNHTPADKEASHLDIFRRLGALYAQTREAGKAELALRKALALRENAETWRKLAEVLMWSTETPEEKGKAAAALRKTLSYGEYVNDAEMWRAFANLQKELGNKEETFEALEHVVRLAPGEKESWERLFVLADELGKKPEVQKLIVSRLSRIDPANPLSNAYLGRDAAKRGDKRMAGHYFKAAVNAGDDYSPKWKAVAYLGLAKIARDNDTALQNYRSALLADPSLLDAWENSIVILRGQGRTREASAYMDKFQMVKQRITENKQITPDLLDNL